MTDEINRELTDKEALEALAPGIRAFVGLHLEDILTKVYVDFPQLHGKIRVNFEVGLCDRN